MCGVSLGTTYHTLSQFPKNSFRSLFKSKLRTSTLENFLGELEWLRSQKMSVFSWDL
jgi:hypothetical protein